MSVQKSLRVQKAALEAQIRIRVQLFHLLVNEEFKLLFVFEGTGGFHVALDLDPIQSRLQHLQLLVELLTLEFDLPAPRLKQRPISEVPGSLVFLPQIPLPESVQHIDLELQVVDLSDTLLCLFSLTEAQFDHDFLVETQRLILLCFFIVLFHQFVVVVQVKSKGLS